MLENKSDVGIYGNDHQNVSIVIGPGRPATEEPHKTGTEVFSEARTISREREWDSIDRHTPKARNSPSLPDS